MSQDFGSFYQQKPTDHLGEYVEVLWTYDGFVSPPAKERLLPTGTMDLIFRIDTEGHASSGLAGPRSEYLTLETSRPFSVIGVHFRPGGGFPFFGVPSNTLHNHGISLDDVWGAAADRLTNLLWDAKTPQQRLSILARALQEHFRGSAHRHPAVDYALQRFDQSNGTCSVGEVVRRIGLSERRFVDLFRTEVGLSPKVFCRIRRFNEALKHIEPLDRIDWSDVALACGYFDQAHFNHDFHSFSGINPSTYLRQRASRTHVHVA